jgi:hypothetical protein
MYALKLVLTLLYVFFSGNVLILIYNGDRPTVSLIMVGFNIATATALNNKGSKVIKYFAYGHSGIMSLFLLGAFYMIVSPIWGRNTDLMLLTYFLLLGGLGLATLISLRFSKYQKTT